MARPPVDSRLQNIEKMEEKIESDVAEIKEIMKNGNNNNHTNTEKVDCLCDETKKELEENAEE